MEQIINNLSWVIGGAQGSGVDTVANIFAKACALGGLYIYTLNSCAVITCALWKCHSGQTWKRESGIEPKLSTFR